jgi:anti-sigma B factor antagonist
VSTLLTRNTDDNLIVYFTDVRIIDESRIESLAHELGALITDGTNKNLILNFQNVGFMSSAMLGKLISFGKKCKTGQVNLRLCGINENIGQVFKLMKLDKVFKIDKDETASLKSIDKKGFFG